MASPAGNPNLFRPPNANPITGPSPFPQPSSYPPPPPSYPSPPPHGAFSYPPTTSPFHRHPFLLYPPDTLHRPAIAHAAAGTHPPNPNSVPSTSPNPISNNNPGARLMALLNPPTSQFESAVSMPAPSTMPLELSPPANAVALRSAPFTLAVVQPVPARLPSSKQPRGRLLGGGHTCAYDVDSRLLGESQPPQLEVTPITKYTSDPGLVLGRQIAVNRTYICYGLKLGAIRVLNINTALRSLLKGHSQRVTDMTFFAEDVHLLASASIDGRVFVWKIDEVPDEENKPQITEKKIIAVQIVGNGESYHPRICWHSHKQEFLFVGIGNRVLKIDLIRIGRGKEFSAEEPLKCPAEKLIDGIQLVGKHDGDVTDLSISQWMITRLVSASKDGTVKIWEDRKAVPLATLRPHDGEPVNSVAFMASPHRPDHINLVTAGPLNREVKLWASTSEEGWLLPGDSESWQCTQTLDLRSSLEPHLEDAFFNQIVVLPQANLIVIANAKKNAIYAVHVDYGPCPASTHMDYIADFTVTMPILSLTGTNDFLADGEQVVQIYCVQTQAIQQYAMELNQCLPPPTANARLAENPLYHAFKTPSSETLSELEAFHGPPVNTPSAINASPREQLSVSSTRGASSAPYSIDSVSSEVMKVPELSTSKPEAKTDVPPLAEKDIDVQYVSSSVPVNLDLAGRLAGLSGPRKAEHGSPLVNNVVDHPVFDYSVDRRVDSLVATAPDMPPTNDNLRKDDPISGPNDPSKVLNPLLLLKLNGNTTHLITPSEILLGVISSSDISHVIQVPLGQKVQVLDTIINNNIKSQEVEVKVAGKGRSGQKEDFDTHKVPQSVTIEDKERPFQTLEATLGVDHESSMVLETCTMRESCLVDDTAETMDQPPSTLKVDVEYKKRDMPEKESDVTAIPQSLSVAKGKKQKGKEHHMTDLSSPSLSPFDSNDSLNEPERSSVVPSTDAVIPQILALQETLNQLMNMQKEMQKQMGVMLAAPIVNEGKRLETALGGCMEKAIKENADVLWAHFQEENWKHERVAKDQMQQLTNLITNVMNRDLPVMLERTLKKEISAVGPTVARAITPVISSVITELFQKGVGDKAVNQLEKSITAKLEATMSRQIQTQFQTSGKQVLQDALRSCVESSVVPAFEKSCKTMFEQVDSAFQKGMNEHTAAAQQQLEAAYTPLALTLRDAINSTSSITQNLTTELIDGQRKLVALVAAGNTKAANPISMQQTGAPMPGLPEMQALSVQQVEAPLDPRKELSRLISECKYEEAFAIALQRSDVSIVSWLCTQVDLRAICYTVPLPLSQGVLLALLQQLACDIGTEASRKVSWMTDVALVINPTDPMITSYIQPILEQVYNILAHQRSLPTTSASDVTNMRLVMHVINSVLMSCK
ncbi:unnamed protein product [Musa acuminata subsp. malaccensis]|uniref:(wild Malaysian banana) hypothetical protein n=1 Tax=Musa acuminata subsp. malaccensis TaxID=214687 RepID=A0A8D7AKV5_MUSAM|nr:PREDICTED: enhancer of mRNA-decapping protein 4-like isoform X2 [Musa acuminata subsp. malaccensis]CAG1849105.1 unnamed protein product [Musa acuminata subsp. malaccensis]